MTKPDRQRQIKRNLQAILEATHDLRFEVGIPETVDELRGSPRIQELAFGECIRRVGEAVAQIDALDHAWLDDTFPGIPWAAVKATRNRITHQYWTLDHQILHDIAVIHLPAITSPVAAHLGVNDPYQPSTGGEQIVSKIIVQKAAPTSRATTPGAVRCEGRRQDGQSCRVRLRPGSTCPAHNWTAPKH